MYCVLSKVPKYDYLYNHRYITFNTFSSGNTLAPISHKDLPRNLRSTRRLSACNEQIMKELQEKMLQGYLYWVSLYDTYFSSSSENAHKYSAVLKKVLGKW